jgi:hypothetical protein
MLHGLAVIEDIYSFTQTLTQKKNEKEKNKGNHRIHGCD